jgi:predicted metal-dependent hydrolase
MPSPTANTTGSVRAGRTRGSASTPVSASGAVPRVPGEAPAPAGQSPTPAPETAVPAPAAPAAAAPQAAPAPQAASSRAIPTRRISFDEALATLPKDFAADGDLFAAHLAAILSGLFPDGEDFFVRSVRHYRDRITDPALKRQVAGFIGQESVHGREHRALNDRLAELGYPTKLVERFTLVSLRGRERVLPPIANLALTAALEHVTATLGETLLSHGDLQAMFGDLTMRELFLWHALEETEHKAVAFDVYRAVGGSESLRIWTMRLLRVGFTAGLAAAVVASVLADRDAWRGGRLLRSWRHFRRSPLMTLKWDMWRQLGEFNHEGFHPDDRDTEALLAEWRDRLFGTEGQLVDKLAGSTAA